MSVQSGCVVQGAVGSDDRREGAILRSSERFKQLWEQADVGYLKGINHMRHPDVGNLYLTRTKLDVPTPAANTC
jgi:hypothetical protein